MAETLINSNQINLGNESAVDLLIQQNEAKVNLANNLNGLGVSANANTESLNQLVSKVADVQADTTKQNIESIVVDNSANCSGMQQHFVVKNGFVFWIGGTSLWYAKCSDLKANSENIYLSNIAVPRTEISSFCTTSTPTSGNDQVMPRLWFTQDGNYLYVCNNYSATIQRYTVTWGTDYSTVVFSDMLTITPQNNGSNVAIQYMDISNDNTKIIITLKNNTGFFAGILDLADIETTPTKNMTILNYTTNTSDNSFFFTENTNYPICEILRNGTTGYCKVYSLEGTNLVLYKEETFKATQSNPYQFRRGFKKFVDKKGNTHIIMAVGYTNGGTLVNDESGYIMVNASLTNIDITQYRCRTQKIDGFYYYANTLTVYEKDNKYYLFCGMCFIALDEDWNIIGNSTVTLNWATNYILYGFIYDDDIYVLQSIGSSSQNYQRVHSWLGKKVSLVKTVSINDTPTQVTYFAQPTTNNINSGIFD